jgi:hypothetical protein
MEEKVKERPAVMGRRSSRTKRVIVEGLPSRQSTSVDQLHPDFDPKPISDAKIHSTRREPEAPSRMPNSDPTKPAAALGRAYGEILSWMDDDAGKATKVTIVED